MTKKLHAKDMKKDEFAEVIGEFWTPVINFANEKRRELMIGLLAVIGLLVIGAFVASWRADRNAAAQVALGEALEALREAEAGDPANPTAAPDWTAVQTVFAGVAAEHGGAIGRMAQHYVGVCQLRAGDAAEAVATLTGLVRGSDWRSSLSAAVLASAQEASGDVAAAEVTLQGLREKPRPGFPADAAAMDLARFYERQGRTSEAAALYREIAGSDEEAPTGLDGVAPEEPSAFAAAAQARLSELES